MDFLGQQHGAADDLTERGQGLVDTLDQLDGVVLFQLDEGDDGGLLASLIAGRFDFRVNQLRTL